MDNVIFSILLVVVGLFVGAFIMILINKLKVSASQKEAEKTPFALIKYAAPTDEQKEVCCAWS